jgi:UDP-N-acetylglucosamine 4-epimerase
MSSLQVESFTIHTVKNICVPGGAGFIGSNLVDMLISQGHTVTVVDNLSSGFTHQINPKAQFIQAEITDTNKLIEAFKGCDAVISCAAIARTPWCIDDPLLASSVNAHGTACILEAARQAKVPRVVLSSSNVVYAFYGPYRATKEMTEMWGRVYRESYGMSVISLRYSNVYGPRQSEEGPSPNVFAAFRKSINEKGYAVITGDGEQSRDFTHISDINRGQLMAALSPIQWDGMDLCTGRNVSMNYVVRNVLKADIQYVPDRNGDYKHIFQSPKAAKNVLGWEATITLEDGLKGYLEETRK